VDGGSGGLDFLISIVYFPSSIFLSLISEFDRF
jgi:hypothetical protein